jgi:DnaJ-class molecular chaperone
MLGGPPGDLILTIRVEPHAYFRREGLDLLVDVPVSLDEAVFGATVDVPTFNGLVSLKIPAGTSSGQKLRLRNRGLADAKGNTGDLLAVVSIQIPKDLTEAQRQTLASLKGQFPNPRRGKW